MGILRADRVSGLGGANAINGSVFFPQNSFIDVKPHSDLSLPGDFTIEMWARLLAGPNITDNARQLSSKGYFTAGSDGNWYLGLSHYSSAEVLFYTYDGQSGAESVPGNIATPDLDRWYHVAAARSGSTLKLFLDGTEVGSGTVSKGLDDGGNNGLLIGGNSKNKGTDTYGDAYGWISNLRIIKGRALYTAAFTVPTGRLEQTSDTVLLCCQSPGNVLEEKTGKILSHNNHQGLSKEASADRLAPDVGEDYGTTFTDNTKFDTLSYMVPPGGTTTQSNRGRGLIMGGASTPGANNQTAIQYLNIQSLGNTQYFGELIVSSRAKQAAASSTRGLAFGGFIAPPAPYTVSDAIDYVTIATQSNAIDFGNLSSSGYAGAGISNNTRGLWAGGYRPNNSAVVNTVDYVTIATIGNATDFGDLIAPQRAIAGGSNTTRGVFGGGAYPAVTDTISYVTIASTGNSTDFGNLTDARDNTAAGSSPTRTCFAGGRDPGASNIIDYITTATTGNAIDFGDLTMQTSIRHGMASNGVRGVIAGDGNITNSLDYITFTTQGNSADFGDQVSSGIAPVTHSFGVCSDSHGGIS